MEKDLEQLIEEDGRAYIEFVEARTDCRRKNFADALEKAVECPVKIMKQSSEGMGLYLGSWRALRAASSCRSARFGRDIPGRG